MQKPLISVLSKIALVATLLGGCGAPPIESAGRISLSLTAAAGREGDVASKPRLGMLVPVEYGNNGKTYKAMVHEFAVGGSSASSLTIDLTKQAAPPKAGARGALVVLAADAPSAPQMESTDADFAEDEVFTMGAVVPRLSAAQADALGIVSILPVYVRFSDDTNAGSEPVFKDTRDCSERQGDETYPQTVACKEVFLTDGYHFGRLDPAREDFDAVRAWDACADVVRSEMSEPILDGTFVFHESNEAIAGAQVQECGEHPGNLGRAPLVRDGEKISFEVGGPADLMESLDAQR